MSSQPSPSVLDDLASRRWRKQLRKRGENYIGDEANVLIALRCAPDLSGLVRFNEFSLNVEFARAPPWRSCGVGTVWGDSDDQALLIWLQGEGVHVRRGAITETVVLAAKDHAYHPIRDYLDGLTWDGVERLHTWLATYLRASGNEDYLAAVGLRFMASAVARVQVPGCQADHVLVLEASQGAGKTTTARVLAVRPEWFAGNLPDVHSKDAPLQLVGRWIVEIAELKAIRNSQMEATKAFITETADTFRPPYGRRTAQFPRQAVFIATTNESTYLRDRTGNRRYWPVKCGSADIPALRRDVHQLWAEAVHEFRSGTPWHLTEAEIALAVEAQGERMHVTELEADVGAYLQSIAHGCETTVRDVLVYGLRLDPDAAGYAESARRLGSAVAEAMEIAGWEKVGRRGGDRRTVYRRVDKGDKAN